MPRWPRDELPFYQEICWYVIFDETPLQGVDSVDEEYFPTADLVDPVWSEDPVSNSQKCLCIHQILRPAGPTPEPNQVEVPPEPEQMDIKIWEDLPHIINVPVNCFWLLGTQCDRLLVAI